MLIVNADDFGRTPKATDSILSCHAFGTISSASAMVFMQDSARAAQLALARGLDVGLHVNFSEDLSGPNTSSLLRSNLRRLQKFLGASRHALLIYHPGLTSVFREVFLAQQEEFLRLYGKEPAHYNGHRHHHLATNMLLSNVLPTGARVRRSFSFRWGEKGVLNLLYRCLVDQRLRWSYRLTDYFFAFSADSASHTVLNALQLARGHTVELMTHPERDAERGHLQSQTLLALLRSVPLASFSDLESSRPAFTSR